MVSKDIQELAKITHMQLMHWAAKGAVLPLVDLRGRGVSRTYDQASLIDAMICRTLNQHYIPVWAMALLTQFLRKFKAEFGGLTIYQAIEKNPKKDYFGLLLVISGHKRRGIDLDHKAVPDVAFKGKRASIWYQYLPFECDRSKLAGYCSETPSAIVINVSAIVRQAKELMT
jgi:hypothetical protein